MTNTTDKSILTAAGKALLAQLNAEEKPLVIDKMIFANVPNRPEFPQPDDVVPSDDVVHEVAVEQRGRLSVDSVIYSTTLTSQEGPFEFNWTGAYCSEYGVLVTIDHHALTPKTVDEPGVSGNTLVRSVVLEYKDIAEITNITVDASSWQYNATPRMKKMDDDVAQAIIDQNGKDWFIEDGFLVTPQASAFNIKVGAGYVSGNRVTLEFDRNVQVPNKPSFIYVDAHREGTPTGEQVTLFDFVVTADDKDDYADANGVKHFVCKIAQVLGDGSVSDLRPESTDKDWSNQNHVINRVHVQAMVMDNKLKSGMIVKTRSRKSGSKFGGGEYQIWRKDEYRSIVDDLSWEPDGWADHQLDNGLVAVLQYNDKIYASTFGAYPNTDDDMYEPVQAFFSKVRAGEAVIENGAYQFSKPPKLAKKNTNNENDLKRLTLKTTGVVFKEHSTFDTDLYSHLLSVEESKRYKIDGLRVEGLVKIAGMWDAQYKNCWFDYTEFGDETLHAGFIANYWSYFERCRLGPVTLITSGTRVANHEFNANVFVATIIGSGHEYSFKVKGTGSIQGLQVFGGEIRGDVIVEEPQPLVGKTPNTMVWWGPYFDGTNTPQDLKGLKISIPGQCPQVNNFTLSGLGIDDNDSSMEIDLFGFKPERRVPLSSKNLIQGGDLTGIVPASTVPFRKYNCEAIYDGDVVNVVSTGTYCYLELDAICPYDGWYSATVIYEKPADKSLQVRFSNKTSGADVYDCFNNKTALRGKEVAGSYTFKANAGDRVCIKFYGGSSLDAHSIKLKSGCITYGAKGLLTAVSEPHRKPNEYYLPSMPTSGDFVRGDRVHCTEPEPGGDIGWVCTTPGSAGSTAVFKSTGKIEV
ncbi:phage tail protein [Vibrio cyclitrophicus]